MKATAHAQKRREQWQLKILCILGLALLLRVLFPLLGYSYTRDVTIFYTPDTASYIAPARELIAHHRFYSDGAPEILRTPGYTLLLTAGLLFGRFEVVTIAFQILLSCFTVYMVYRTAWLLFERERIALAAAALYAIEPFSILFTGLLATETLFTVIVMVGVYYLVRYLRQQSLADLLASAGALAASVYVRPAGYFLPMIIAAGLAALALVTAQQNKPRAIAHLSAFLLVSFGLTGLWQVRNKIETGYSGFSTIASQNMYFCLAGSVLAAQQHVRYYEMRDRLGYQDWHSYFQEHPEQKTWPIARIVEYMSRDGEHILLGNPLTYTQIYFQGVLRSIFDPGSTEFLRFFDLYPKNGGLLEIEVDKGIIKTLEALLLTPLLGWTTVVLLALQFVYLSGVCIALSRRLIRDPAIFAALLIVGYYLAIAGGAGDWGRFRHPAMPIVCVIAGYGLCVVWERLRTGESRLSYASVSPALPSFSELAVNRIVRLRSRAVFLDRDGVINKVVFRRGKPTAPRQIAEFEIEPDADEALRGLRAAGFKLFVVTNQPDLARGLMTATPMRAMTQTIMAKLAVDAVKICPHDERDGCDCRKPGPAMLIELARKHDVALSESYIVGDSWKDTLAGKAAGCTSIILDRHYNRNDPADYRVTDLNHAVALILGRSSQ